MIKAIETQYKGYRFRSRLEARWAVFFDNAGIEWLYEPEGYYLDSGPYLPDFFLPEIAGGTWIEVKPNAELSKNNNEQRKIVDLVRGTGRRGMIVKGLPLEGFNGDYYWKQPGYWDGSAYWMEYPIGEDGPYFFCVCPYCEKVGIEFDGRGSRVCSHGSICKKNVKPWKGIERLDHDGKCYSAHHPKLVYAAEKARSARFEHGETPR